ncbi:TetR/AcrR family transcriptional regulator [Thalassotalea sp. M1531]|uniref:TetR/AcrR family transcriptional regulator n=1 Tax=Thalassotalea algicola TaxID=2716224 RepID=A0A7Y0L978_9GAMM|nr:TetR/AcrR family transcriptional regulator [Thalassotalea algicola]NMP30283.1 TetR/AcrR family transcriptional regulator [Thalassotalea algicola]
MTKNRSKNETKRKQILASATHLFTEQGYASTSMALIAKHADVSKQTVYSHFGSKEELFSAAIEQKCDSSILLDFAQVTLTDPHATLLAIAKRFFAMITSKEALAVHKICAFEAKSYPQLSELFYQAGPERLTAEMAKLLVEFNDKGLLSIENPHFAATQFLHLVKGEAWMRIEFNTQYQLSEQQIDQYISSSVDLFLRGYAPIN